MLTQAVESYLEVRRAMGFALHSEGSLLQSFAKYSDGAGQSHICTETAIQWAGMARSIATRARRLGQVIRLARYLRAEDQRHQVPPAVFGCEKGPRPVPYIFSADNVKRLVQAASELGRRNPTVRDGIRDRAMLHLCFAGGLRVSELVGLRTEDFLLQPQASILVHGKGRKERCLPLWKGTASALRAWLVVRGTSRAPELLLNARSTSMTRAGFEYILRKHVCAAAKRCPSLSAKRVSPHVLRHTCALTILQATKDLRKVSLWLGHSSMQTTEIYTRADPSVKLEALESVIAPKLRTGRFKATDQLITMLNATPVMRSEKPST